MTHGKSSTYNNYGCRCKPCTKAWAEYMRPRANAWRKGLPYKKNVRPNAKTRKKDRYSILIKLQNGVCGICHRSPGDRLFDEDHDHATGEIRGLLCRSCNTALGKLGDSAETLRRAATYLEKPPYRQATQIKLT